MTEDRTRPAIRFPLSGEWLSLPTPGHDRYAFDFGVLVGWRLNAGGWLRYLLKWVPIRDFFAWNLPVFAPFSGRVARVRKREPDHDPINLIRGLRRVSQSSTSNSVMIEREGVFAWLIHFRRDSITVNVGDLVQRGQPLGRVGNSGRSLFPHLHLQLMDGPDPAQAEILPFLVEGFERWDGRRWILVHQAELQKAKRYRFQ